MKFYNFRLKWYNSIFLNEFKLKSFFEISTSRLDKLLLTVEWKRGQRYNLVTKRVLITRSTWQNPIVKAKAELEKALMNPVCKNWLFSVNYFFLVSRISSSNPRSWSHFTDKKYCQLSHKLKKKLDLYIKIHKIINKIYKVAVWCYYIFY